MGNIVRCFYVFFVQINLVLPLYDPYLILNLRRSASIRDIKKSYRNLALLIHPDKNWCDSEAHKKFITLRNAYLLINTSENRANYDARHPEAGHYTTPWNWNLPNCAIHRKGDSSTKKETSRKKYHRDNDYLTEALLELEGLVQLFQKWHLLRKLTLVSIVKRCVILYCMILFIKPIFRFLHNVTWTKSTKFFMLCFTFIWNYQNIGNIITKEPDIWLAFRYVLCFAVSETISDTVYNDIKNESTSQFWFFMLLRLYHYAFFIYIYYYFTVDSYAEEMSETLFWSFELFTQPVVFIMYGIVYILSYVSYYTAACVLYFPIMLCRYIIQKFRYD